ncbi:CDP-glycerol glycerophosphotransferase family protein [Sporosarcina jiandibaonis]|uniref:CDP-glycerol glycerophosphotransferase family protein n=1 Tax=Sporosarcina jiandibaonis TaxID=2715535 RepID=UPI001553E07C|nr:CDP-glycerol glycerophosphotransferase family protein [Sporosarcina jiandibaonis]
MIRRRSIVKKAKKILRIMNNQVRHLTIGDIKVSSLKFIGNLMQVRLNGRGVKNNDSNYRFIVKDMHNSNKTYKFNCTLTEDNELIAEVNLTEITSLMEKELGKWSFFVAINNFEIRLSTEAKAQIELQKHSITENNHELTIQPYITKYGNISITSMKVDESGHLYEMNNVLNAFTSKKLPNHVNRVSHSAEGILIEGSAKVTRELQKYVSLVMKKRASTLQYEFPITWLNENSWQSKVDVHVLESLKGIYDYYLLLADERTFRMKLHENAMIDADPLFRETEKESRQLISYRTKKDSLSLQCKISNIFVQNLIGKVQSDIVSLQGVINKEDLPKHKKQNKYCLILRQRNTDELSSFPVTLNESKNGYDLSFQLDYKDLLPSDELENYRWDVYLQLNIRGSDHLFRFRVKKDQETDSLAYDTRKKIEDENLYQIFFYRTRHGHVSISLSSLTINRDLSSYRIRNKKLCLGGYAYLEAISFNKKNKMNRFLVIRNRESDSELNIPLENITSKKKLSGGGFDYKYAGFYVEIPLESICDLQQNSKDILDLYIQIHYKNEVAERKLGLQNYKYYKDDYRLKYSYQQNNQYYKNYLTLTPRGNIKIESYSYTKEMMRYIKYGVHMDRFKNRNEDVWIIGERPDTAQDTGYHFFKYCRENYPEKKIYYAIDENSADLKNIKDLGNVLLLGSMEHLKTSLIATTFIGSHDIEYILPVKSTVMDNYRKGKRVFLQHGVLGRKNVEYHKYYYIDPFQMFCVSSQSEKEMVIDEFGYDDEEVMVTGLSRFDALLEKNNAERSILLIPTWREWLNTEEDFMASEYFERYKGLISNERLLKLLNQHSVNLNVYPHYRMQQFIEHFEKLETDRVSIIELGEKNVQDLLIENMLMITDYSSVSFDFNYMSKPIIFYHFDSDTFFKNGILRPIEETFLGDICKTEEAIIESIEYYLVNEFEEKQEVTDKKHLVFDQIDASNNERIYNEIISLR